MKLETIIKLKLNNFDVMDGNAWNISFGKMRNDQINSLTSSYFLRAGKCNTESTNIDTFVTSTFFKETISLLIGRAHV